MYFLYTGNTELKYFSINILPAVNIQYILLCFYYILLINVKSVVKDNQNNGHIENNLFNYIFVILFYVKFIRLFCCCYDLFSTNTVQLV